MDSTRFDRLARALARPASRRRAVGVLLGGAAVAARLSGLDGATDGAAAKRRTAVKRAGNGKRPAKVALCHQGHTITVAEPAVKAHLADGDSIGPCNAPGSATCQAKLFGLCTINPFDIDRNPCCNGMACIGTINPIVTACQLRCATDADCAAAFPNTALACRTDVLVCPFEAAAGQKCCVPR